MNLYYELFINPCDSLKNALRQHPEGEIGHRPRQLTSPVIPTDLRPQGAAFLTTANGLKRPFFGVFWVCSYLVVHTVSYLRA